jgi:CTP:molybdopterin cytidylyltransferase MocA
LGVPAIVTAGDSRAAKAVYGKSKVYLEVDGLALVAHVVRTLQDCPEVDSVWVVGDTGRLEAALGSERLKRSLRKPLHIVPQQRDLISNAWETYRRVLSGNVLEGRDPRPDELDTEVFFLSGDIPLATPQEFSSFIQQSQALDIDYALRLCPAESLDVFRAAGPDETGVTVAYFNTRDGRFRQNNLHYARPGRIGRRDRIEEMYELRHPRRVWNMFTLALRLLAARVGGFKIAAIFGMMHIAGIADRKGRTRLARLLARAVTLEINRSTISKILDTRFAFVITESGGCGLDIDTEEEYDAVCERFEEWSDAQRGRAAALYGPLPAQIEEGSTS